MVLSILRWRDQFVDRTHLRQDNARSAPPPQSARLTWTDTQTYDRNRRHHQQALDQIRRVEQTYYQLRSPWR